MDVNPQLPITIEGQEERDNSFIEGLNGLKGLDFDFKEPFVLISDPNLLAPPSPTPSDSNTIVPDRSSKISSTKSASSLPNKNLVRFEDFLSSSPPSSSKSSQEITIGYAFNQTPSLPREPATAPKSSKSLPPPPPPSPARIKKQPEPTPPKTTSLKTTAQVKDLRSSTEYPQTARMASFSRAQQQCLELCHKTTALIDRISVRILEYLTSSKTLPHGFNSLAHDFLDVCQILFSIEAGLMEYNRTSQRFPPAMIAELDHKFRVTQADFQLLYQMLGKFLGEGSLMKRWGKLFGDNDIKKMTTALGKTRESLRISSLVFQWSLGNDKVEREMGIGYTGLAAALDRMDKRTGAVSHNPNGNTNGNTNGNINGNGNMNPQPLPAPTPQQQHQQAAAPWTERSSSIHNMQNGEGTIGSHESRVPPSPRHTMISPIIAPEPRTHGASSIASNDRHRSPMSDSYELFSPAEDTRSMVTGITEPDNSASDEMAAMELGPHKIVRHKVDPASMPRCYPRKTVDSESPAQKTALVSAIRGKNHKLAEQMLTRGVSPNGGPNVNILKEAIYAHDEEGIRLLLLYGADPNEPDRDGITPLYAAVEKSFFSGAKTLLKYGADPNLVAGTDLESPLAAAVASNMAGFAQLFLAYNGDANHITSNGVPLLSSAINKKTPKKFIDLLLDYNADPNAKSRDGKTALFEALTVGRADIVTTLLEHRANPNLPGPKHMLWPSVHYPACLQVLLAHGADHKKTPGIMELAVSLNNIEAVRMLLNAGVDPNLKKDNIYTPLCTAIRDDRANLFNLLLSSGADPNLMASEYPCFKCITHDRVHFLPMLVMAGADLNHPKGILETAVAYKNMEALNWLLDQGLNPNDKSPKGRSPLTTAIREDRMDMVDLLLLRGADPHIRGEDWPVCMAVSKPAILERILNVLAEPRAFKGLMERAVHADQLTSVKLLMAAGVSVEDRNGGVFSPLTTAVRENHKAIYDYLLREGGADVNAPGEHLPIVKALRRWDGENNYYIETLLENGADPNKVYRGWNGFMQAVENGDTDVLKLLASHAGVDLEVHDELGRTVVEIAASRGWDEAVKILQEGDIKNRQQ